MDAPALAAVFVVGLLGGVHCIGMCGGVVTALSAGSRTPPSWPVQLSFNFGRIAVYALAGAAAGAAGSMALFVGDVLPVQLALYLFANLMLAGLGLYLLGVTRYIAVLERIGSHVWRVVRPLTKLFLPANTAPRALALGALWGWMPCGLVYSILATALVTGDAVHGAAVMFAFGLGTLPNLLFAGALMRWLSARRAGGWMRSVAGAMVLGLGLFGLAHAGIAGQRAVSSFLCFTP